MKRNKTHRTIQRLSWKHRLIIEGAIMTVQKRWLGLVWMNTIRYALDGDKKILIGVE